MKIKEIMSSNIASVSSKDSVEKAAQLMKQYNVGSVPVCDNNSVVGIITDRDITLRSVASGQNQGKKVCDIMTNNPVTANPEMDTHEAAKLMSDKQIRRLPIVENNSLVGMVALGDLATEPKLQDNAEAALKNISQPKNSYR